MSGECRAAASAANGHAAGVGINYLGAQARYFFAPLWAGELRYLTGTVDSGGGYVTSQVLGARGYRFFRTGGSYRFFLGGELAAVNSSDNQRGIFYKAVGAAAGGFEYFFSKRIALSIDAGPYVFTIKEQLFGGKDSSLDFIANGSVNFYFF